MTEADILHILLGKRACGRTSSLIVGLESVDRDMESTGISQLRSSKTRSQKMPEAGKFITHSRIANMARKAVRRRVRT